jgi:uncharacterized protein (TIGR02001 family)
VRSVAAVKQPLPATFAMAAGLALGGAPCRAWAQIPEGDLSVTGSIALVSDYRFRGASLSNREPALQGGIEVERQGWATGAWASTSKNSDGPGTEIDFYASRKGMLGGFSYSVTAYAYVFEGQPVYFEGQATVERDFGPARFGLEIAYAPPQHSVRENIYLGASVAVPVGRGVQLFARGGAERSYFFGDKLDWEAGARWSRGPVTLAVSLVGVEGDLISPGDRSPAPLFSVSAAW